MKSGNIFTSCADGKIRIFLTNNDEAERCISTENPLPKKHFRILDKTEILP